MQALRQIQYQCASGIQVRRSAQLLNYTTATEELAFALNANRGVLLASSFEYPGRYTRLDIGFINPPLAIVAKSRSITITALNKRGQILLPELHFTLLDHPLIQLQDADETQLNLQVREEEFRDCEEMRSRRPGVFTVLRKIIDCFRASEDSHLGLYGAFGYDLTFQFEDVKRFQKRDSEQRDLVLYLPDQITVADHRAEQTLCYNYEFNCRSWESVERHETTGGFRRQGESVDYAPAIRVEKSCDHEKGEFEKGVRRALEYFQRGDLFEVVPGQCFFEPCKDTPAEIFARLKRNNPAPYGALMNLGEQEYLVAASPEMFVRVDGKQIETCPISGTIKRGEDAIGDARQIRELLNSEKDEAELSMCTDVDRNDKARVCVPGTVKVVGRRQIEMYSRLIHTVDHVKGQLQAEMDALDGFLAHTWAVTVTGAPKLAAMQYIEEYEKSPRCWYGGALGYIGFDGNLNTGLTLRTIRIKDGVAEIRAGATLLADSDPQAEEQETRLKASALLDAIAGAAKSAALHTDTASAVNPATELHALMVDHQDSFVHNLATYFREYGVKVITLRPVAAREYLQQHTVDLVILSPGPSAPAAFDMYDTIDVALNNNIPLFGVCLGLQGLVEYFGGALTTLSQPMHGKESTIQHHGTPLFAGIAQQFRAGRYHSLVAARVPECLQVTATTEDGSVMAIEHQTLPISAVQFHPESIMSLEGAMGHKLVGNLLQAIVSRQKLPETA